MKRGGGGVMGGVFELFFIKCFGEMEGSRSGWIGLGVGGGGGEGGHC